MLNPLGLLASCIVLMLLLSGYQTYQNASECRFYGQSYSWLRGSCVASSKQQRRGERRAPRAPTGTSQNVEGAGVSL